MLFFNIRWCFLVSHERAAISQVNQVVKRSLLTTDNLFFVLFFPLFASLG